TAPSIMRKRRVGHAVIVPFRHASLIPKGCGMVRWTPAAERAVANRATVHAVAPRILAMSRRLLAAGPSVARARLGPGIGVKHLDDHQAINVAVMTLEGGW